MLNYECGKSYLVQANDSYRSKGYSGGLLDVLMYNIIKTGGVVCALVWDETFHVRYKCIENLNELCNIKFPYIVINSDQDYIDDIKKEISSGKKILFIGLPCQIVKTKKILNAENVIFVEMSCHGAVDSSVASKYFDMFNMYGVKNISFYEDRQYYYYNTCMNIQFKDGKYFHQGSDKNIFWRALNCGLSLDDSCVECKINTESNYADISTSDILNVSQWDVVGDGKCLDDGLGTSYMKINTNKGCELIKQCQTDWNKVYILIHGTENGFKSLYSIKCDNKEHDRFRKLLNMKSYDFDKAYYYTVEHRYDVGINGDWTDYNYGAVLTAAALSWCIEDMGYSTLLVQYGVRPLYNPKVLFSAMGSRIWSTVNTSEYYETPEQCEELNEKIDIYLLGSDVNWNYQYMFSGIFLGEYFKPRGAKIAYSTSFGDDKYLGTSFSRKKAEGYIKDFGGVSVREDVGVDVCNQLQVKADHVLDPVFICDFHRYDNLMEDVNIKLPQRYLLYYGVHADPLGERKKCVEYIAQKLDLGIVTILGIENSLNKGADYYTVEEFLYCIKHATFFVGDSFHGMCFSIIFHVPFIAFALPYNARERMYSLARDFGLEKRVCLGFNKKNIDIGIFTQLIKWEEVDRRLSERKEYSCRWLREQLEKAYQMKENIEDDWIIRLRNRVDFLKRELEVYKYKNLELCLKSIIPAGTTVAIRGAGSDTKRLLPFLERFFCQNDIKLKFVSDADEHNSVMYKNELMYAVSDRNIEIYTEIDKILVITTRHHEFICTQLYNKGIDKDKIIDISAFLISNDITF